MKTKPSTSHDPVCGMDVAVSDEAKRAACGKLLGMMGISAAAPGADCITVDYDLRQVTLAQIEAVVTDTGLVLRGSLHRWRRALWRFAEGNEFERVAHTGKSVCCNRPPAGMC